MRYLTIDEVIYINEDAIKGLSPYEIIGVKDRNMLEAAISRPQQSVFGNDAYPTVFDKAAALFESLAKNHPFHNANKRTALTCLVYFLYNNGYFFEMNEDKAQDFTVDMVVGKYSFEEICAIIEEHCITK